MPHANVAPLRYAVSQGGERNTIVAAAGYYERPVLRLMRAISVCKHAGGIVEALCNTAWIVAKGARRRWEETLLQVIVTALVVLWLTGFASPAAA